MLSTRVWSCFNSWDHSVRNVCLLWSYEGLQLGPFHGLKVFACELAHNILWWSGVALQINVQMCDSSQFVCSLKILHWCKTMFSNILEMLKEMKFPIKIPSCYGKWNIFSQNQWHISAKLYVIQGAWSKMSIPIQANLWFCDLQFYCSMVLGLNYLMFYGSMVLCFFDSMILWSYDPMVWWFYDSTVLWSNNLVVPWSYDSVVEKFYDSTILRCYDSVSTRSACGS